MQTYFVVLLVCRPVLQSGWCRPKPLQAGHVCGVVPTVSVPAAIAHSHACAQLCAYGRMFVSTDVGQCQPNSVPRVCVCVCLLPRTNAGFCSCTCRRGSVSHICSNCVRRCGQASQEQAPCTGASSHQTTVVCQPRLQPCLAILFVIVVRRRKNRRYAWVSGCRAQSLWCMTPRFEVHAH